jgi:predicted Zn-dependent protease
MRAGQGFAVSILFCVIAGCAAAPQSQAVDRWVARQGGVIADAHATRLQTVAQPLLDCCKGRAIRVQVLATDAACAFSWPSGRVFVTRGLMDHLSDQELAAVVSHELGHLLADGQLKTVASVNGCCMNADREVRADAAGVALLRTQGLSAEAMVSMLRKVEKYGSLPPSCLEAMDRRIALLSTSDGKP